MLKSVPQQFISKALGAEHARDHKAHTTKAGVYTCPMHPVVVRDEPGACPKYGMALEPRDGRRRRMKIAHMIACAA